MDPSTHLLSSGTCHPIFKQLSLSCSDLFIFTLRFSLWCYSTEVFAVMSLVLCATKYGVNCTRENHGIWTQQLVSFLGALANSTVT